MFSVGRSNNRNFFSLKTRLQILFLHFSSCEKIANGLASNSLPRLFFSLFLIDHPILALDRAFRLREVILGFIAESNVIEGGPRTTRARNSKWKGP